MKKFYSEVAVAGAEGNYSVVLDERILRTPGKVHCALPTSNLADAIAAEWRAQNDEIDEKSMPLTMIVNAAVDRVVFEENGNLTMNLFTPADATVGYYMSVPGSRNTVGFQVDHGTCIVSLIGCGGTLNMCVGNVGIGVAPSTSRLHIRNDAVATNALEIDAYDGSDLFKVWEESTGSAEVYVYDASGTAKVRLDSDGPSFFNGGCLGIGTAAPAQLLEVQGDVAGTATLIQVDNADNTNTASDATVRITTGGASGGDVLARLKAKRGG